MLEFSPRRLAAVTTAGALVLFAGAALHSRPAAAEDLTISRPVAREKVLAALPGLEAIARRSVSPNADAGVPGLAIAIVHEGEVVYLKGFGTRESGQPEAVDADTVFQLASLSKPISATVVAALVGQEKLSWDTPVSRIDPTFQLGEAYPSQQVTVQDLFAHRSGLPGDAGNELEELGFDRSVILQRLRLVPPAYSFRAGYSYSNFGLTAGALAAAAVTGKTWEEVAQDELYGPLGMSSTSSRHADFLRRDNRSRLHISVDGKWVAKLTRQPDAQSPAGGVSSSARDLAQWMKLELADGMFDGKRLIGADALAATHRPLSFRGMHPVTGAASFYGLGWNVEFGPHGVSWGHAGAFSVGARTLATLYPESGLGIVVLANAFPSGVPEAVAASFFDLVFEGRVTRDWATPWNAIYGGMFGPAVDAAKRSFGTKPSNASPALPPEAYVGFYANDYVGRLEVTESDGLLTLKLGPDGAKSFPLTHFDRDTFIYHPVPELPDMPTGVGFAIGPDGRATEVTLDDLNGFGLGTLTRQP